MPNSNKTRALALTLALMAIGIVPTSVKSQDNNRSLTPLQLEIEKQKNQLNSIEVEDRRDALMRLAALRHPEASRAAAGALQDGSPIVRVTAAAAVHSLPASESAAALLPLLSDKVEFVRQEVAYALGKTRSETAVAPLLEVLGREKKDGVRGAIVVALGEIADEAAVVPLSQLLRPQLNAERSKKNKKQNLLVLRAAAHSLGQIGNRAAVPALLATLQDDKVESDVRREAAIALGLIGDASALPALNAISNADDPYLSLAAFEAYRRISHQRSP